MIKVIVGDQTYEFPDGTSEDQMRRAIEADRASAAPPESQNIIAGVLDSFTQGASFGFGDELTGLEAAVLGRTPEGGWFDYSKPFDERYEAALTAERGQNKQFREERPVLATGAEIGGAVASSLMPGGAIGTGLKAGVPMGTRILASTASGAGYGGLHGYGSGEGGAGERLNNAWFPAVTGGVAGAIAPPVAEMLPRAGSALAEYWRRIRGSDPLQRTANRLGVQRAAVDVLSDVVDQERVYGEGARGILRSGPTGMMLDAGPYAQATGRYTLNTGPGRHSGRAVMRRGNQAAVDMDAALTQHLGAPQGPRAATRANAMGTAARRSNAYAQAFGPINYADMRNVQAVTAALDYIPDDELARGLAKANKAIEREYGKTVARTQRRQIEFNVADDGTVSVIERPSMEQLDFLKRAFDELADDAKDKVTGRVTSEARAYGNTARRLRQTLLQVSPIGDDGTNLYRAALDAGADKKAIDQAIELGQDLLKRSTTREMVREATNGMADAERRAAAASLRANIDEMMANIPSIRTEDNQAIQAAYATMRELEKPAVREKIAMVIGDDAADELMRDVLPQIRALRVRANVQLRSDTAPNLAVQKSIDSASAPPLNTEVTVPGMLAGGYNALTGRTQRQLDRASQQALGDIARLLTSPQGDDAVKLFQQLIHTRRAQDAAMANGWPSALAALLATRSSRAPAVVPASQ